MTGGTDLHVSHDVYRTVTRIRQSKLREKGIFNLSLSRNRMQAMKGAYSCVSKSHSFWRRQWQVDPPFLWIRKCRVIVMQRRLHWESGRVKLFFSFLSFISTASQEIDESANLFALLRRISVYSILILFLWSCSFSSDHFSCRASVFVPIFHFNFDRYQLYIDKTWILCYNLIRDSR